MNPEKSFLKPESKPVVYTPGISGEHWLYFPFLKEFFKFTTVNLRMLSCNVFIFIWKTLNTAIIS